MSNTTTNNKMTNPVDALKKIALKKADKTASKIPADDKEARLAVMKIPMALKVANQSIDKLTSSRSLEKQFKRTISRLYELTSKSYK